MKIRNREAGFKSELNMTSMIDIVFLLLIFFVMSFKVVEMEGDFSVKMPLAGSGAVTVDPTDLPLKLRLRADATGKLVSMSLNEISLGTDFDQLSANVINLIGATTPVEGGEGEGPEIEIDTDYNLRYEYVIRSITAVSGYKDGDEVVKLIEKIKFANPRR
jgi:biopolymer transport protein ExbD